MTDTGMSAFKCDTRQVREFIIDCITAGTGKDALVPFVQSSPGMGKSAIVRSIADEFNLHLIDHRLSTSVPEDLTGLPHFEKNEDGTFIARHAPFDTFPIKGSKIPDGKDGFLLFLDEMNSASKAVQAAGYKILLDKMVGQNPLHDRVVIVAAGNLATDRAIVNPLSTATQSRVVHLEMQLVFDHFLEDVMLRQNWDQEVIAYLSYAPGKLMDFRPDHNEKTFCCPRTWDMLNRLHQRNSGTKVVKDPNTGVESYALEKKAPLYAGTITSGVATEFVQFTKIFSVLPKIRDIINDPEGLEVPRDPPLRFAVASYLMHHVSDESFEKIAIYINRFPAEFRVLFFRGLMVQKPAMRAHPMFRKAMVELSRYLHD